MTVIRRAAVAGQWYPGTAAALAREVDRYLAAVSDAAAADADGRMPQLRALVAPHAGLPYSGPVAAWAYAELRDRSCDLIVLVGPSHFVDFDGVALSPAHGFDTPFGVVPIDRGCCADLLAATPVVHEDPRPHLREHSLEMQLPFIHRVCPQASIVPLLIGRQTAATAVALAGALGQVLSGRDAILVASTDLSHYHDAVTAASLDHVVIDTIVVGIGGTGLGLAGHIGIVGHIGLVIAFFRRRRPRSGRRRRTVQRTAQVAVELA